MPYFIANRSILIAVTMLIFSHIVDASRVLAQPAANSLRNFSAVEVSDAALQITVDCTYTGEVGTSEVSTHATPEESGGVFDPRTVNFDAVPLRVGDNTIIVEITKRPESRDFTSKLIRVCMSSVVRAFFCEDFPYTKTWTTTSTPTSPQPLIAPHR